MNNEIIKGKFSVGYDRQIVTPEIGTWLGGYGNGPDRATIGKIFDDDDLFVTAIAITDKNGETIVPITVDVVRMPVGLFRTTRENIVKETGLKEQNIIISATHSHSAPDATDGSKGMEKWFPFFIEKCTLAVKNALADRKPAEIFVGIREVEGLNFVRRYMLDDKFIGTNNGNGNAHESKADNHLQVIRFAREGAKDVLLANWGAHPDHSKTIGGPSGTPEFHRGCSADYIYSLRKTVEQNADVNFAFFEAAAGNLNPSSLLPGEHIRVEERMEKEGVKRFVAYGETLAVEVLVLLNTSLEKVNDGEAKGIEGELSVKRPDGVEIGGVDYNQAETVATVIYKRPLEKPTAESISAAEFLVKEYELGDREKIDKAAADENDPLYEQSLCAKVLFEGGVIPFTNEKVRNCGLKIAKFFKFTSGPYGSAGILRRAHNAKEPPFNIPLYALSCGDIAFACAPGEIFDTNGLEVKTASPFKFTFYIEQTGGAFGYFPSKLAWSHGGYELATTSGAEGTAENISAGLIDLLNKLNK